MRKGCAGEGAEINFCAGAGSKLLVSGDKVGVQVSLEDVADRQPVLFGSLEIEVNIPLGIDHHCLAFRSEHVGGMC